MLRFYHYKILTLISLLAVTLSACGASSAQTQDQISTAVAQTVQAQDSLTEIANVIVPTSTAAIEIPATEIVSTATTAPVSAGNPGCTLSAELLGETPPDGTIFKPGEYFWKTWTLKNTGTCTWDPSYKLVFWSGDLMDALVSYPIPEIMPTDTSKDISIYLRAPATEGTFTGYWKIQAPWEASFGVGGFYDEPIYVQVAVSNAKKPAYEVTNVDFTITRDPAEGCPANVYYTLTATISTNGPMELQYYWNASGSLYTQPTTLTFESAQAKSVSYTLGVNKLSTKPTDYWIQFFIPDPKGLDYKKIYVNHKCE